jgi:hypothetical protein
VAASIATSATPAEAGYYRHWHPGYGWYSGGYYRHGWYGGHRNWGGAAAAGVLGGLALGALAGATYAYGPYYYGACSWQNRPVYDSWGNFAGYAPVKVCY